MRKIAVLILTVLLCTVLTAVVNAELMGDDNIIDTGPIFGESSGKGDVNNDGSINSEDITALANALASGTASSLDAANVYTDDETGTGSIINIKDLIYLSQYVFRTENVFKSQGIISNLAIPVADENGEFLKTEYNGNEGLFVHVLADSELLWIQLDKDAQERIYPSIEDAEKYLGKLCSAVQLLNGKYALTSLAYNELEDGTYAGLNKDEDKLENTLDKEILYIEDGIKKITFSDGTASCFRDYTANSLCNFNFTLTDDTIIIVKNIKNKDTANEVVEYILFNNKDVFISYYESPIYNASIILQNNTDTSTEDALVIFAEAEDYSLIQNARIVSYSDVTYDEDGLWYNYYTAYNPYTGKSEKIRGSLSDSAASVANGAFPTGTRAIYNNGAIYENEGYTKEDVIDVDTDFVWLIDYDTENQTITVLPEGSTDESDALTYEYTENTAFSKLEYMTKVDLFKWGAMSQLDAETLYRHINSNDYKCYNTKVLVGDTYKTKYAKYIKMYVSPIENTNVLDYAIVIVHGKEAEENLNM